MCALFLISSWLDYIYYFWNKSHLDLNIITIFVSDEFYISFSINVILLLSIHIIHFYYHLLFEILDSGGCLPFPSASVSNTVSLQLCYIVSLSTSLSLSFSHFFLPFIFFSGLTVRKSLLPLWFFSFIPIPQIACLWNNILKKTYFTQWAAIIHISALFITSIRIYIVSINIQDFCFLIARQFHTAFQTNC